MHPDWLVPRARRSGGRAPSGTLWGPNHPRGQMASSFSGTSPPGRRRTARASARCRRWIRSVSRSADSPGSASEYSRRSAVPVLCDSGTGAGRRAVSRRSVVPKTWSSIVLESYPASSSAAMILRAALRTGPSVRSAGWERPEGQYRHRPGGPADTVFPAPPALTAATAPPRARRPPRRRAHRGRSASRQGSARRRSGRRRRRTGTATVRCRPDRRRLPARR